MRSKYELDSFAVYKGKKYSAYTKNGINDKTIKNNIFFILTYPYSYIL